jgi:hypothetical protein
MEPKTPVIRTRRLGDPVLVPAPAVAGALLLILGLGGAVGWLAGRGSAGAVSPSALSTAPVIVERRCPEPAVVPAAPKMAAAPATATSAPVPAPVPAKIAAPAAPAAEPVHAARAIRARVPRLAAIGGDTWEPARM